MSTKYGPYFLLVKSIVACLAIKCLMLFKGTTYKQQVAADLSEVERSARSQYASEVMSLLSTAVKTTEASEHLHDIHAIAQVRF